MQKIKKPISILLTVLMVFSVFAVVPFTASAAVGDVLSKDDYLTFTAEEAGSTVTLNFKYGSNFKYNLNGAGWESYSENTPITLNNVGDYVRFSGKDTEFNDYDHVSLTGKVACSGSVMSLRLDDNGKSQGLISYCFQYMFYNCTSLTQAPELPETTLARYCYGAMFVGCTSLTKAPVLPATTLADYCYRYMFRGCTSLTELPALPATTLAKNCYAYMFYDCSNIRISDAPGTVDGITYSAAYRIPTTGTGTSAEDALDDMFGGTGGKFTGTPNINTTYYLPAPPTYTVTWKNGDGTTLKTDTDVAKGTTPEYNGTTPTKADGECCTYTFHGWNNGLHTYTGALPAVNEDTTFTAVFTDAPKDGYYKTTTGGHSVYSIVPLGDNVADGETKPEFIGGSDGENFRLTSLKNCKYNYYDANGNDLGASFSKGVDGDYSVVVTSDSMPKIVLVKPVYTISWNNWDGTPAKMLGTDVIHGEIPVYDGTEPTRADDDANTYTFTGWEPALAHATDNATYTAKFDATPKTFVASVTSNGTTTKYANFSDALNAWVDGSTLTLLANVTTSSVIHFTSGVKTLDLNGYGIKNTSANYEASNSVIYIRGSGTQLTLQDSRPNETTHYFTAPAGNAGLATDISDIDSGDQQSFHGGYLTGGNCFSGGGIRVDDGANLIMTGGTIIGNRGIYGGGIDVEKSGSAGGSATISGGAIMYNYGTNYNGAIHTNGANYVSVSNCKITNNYAEHGAGGAYKSSINGGFSGNLIIKDNKTGNTECNVLIESNQYISLTSALGDDAYIGITMSNPGVFTNSAETANNDASKFKSDDASYTVGKNADGQLYLYKSLIAGHSLSLDGNIGINFYLDPSVAGLTAQQVTADKLSYTFAWADGNPGKAKVDVAAQAAKKNFRVSEDGKYIIITCHVCAAEMTCDVDASFTLNGKSDSEVYTVRKYCDSVIKATPAQIDGLFGGTEKYNKLVELVKAMLNYGAMAQTKFKVNTGYLANNKVDYNPGDVTDAKLDAAIAAANGTDKADNMNDVAAALGAKWFSTSLIYLDDSTLRHYFVKATDTFKPSAYTGNKSNYYYYVEVTGIPAAELDNLQTFKVGTESFKYSALDFVKGMINSSADGESKNLAKALYWYNQAANAYFPAPAPVQKIVDLSTLTGNYEAQNNDVLTGVLSGDKQITIADGATVTLKNADISQDFSADSAGITLLGNATILLEGTNTVMGGYGDRPGIYVPANTTLTIDGDGSLTASGQENGCGIGGGLDMAAGNIVINGGTITATGGEFAAGIGSGYGATCGNITINGGTVAATGGSYGAGIGSGYGTTCGNIMIADTVTKVTATKGEDAPDSIGAGTYGTCGTVTIGGVVTGSITDSPYTYQP